MYTEKVKSRRAHSMPSRFVMPSLEMGEYEEDGAMRRRSAPARGGLFPLREEGTYGALPPGPPPPPIPYKGRERKPKIYSSYAVDHECRVHSKKLADAEKDHGNEHIAHAPPRRMPSWSARSSASPGRRPLSSSTSAANSRGPSSERFSPDPPLATNGHGGVARKNSGKFPGGQSSTSWTSSAASTSSVSSQRYSATGITSGYRYKDLRDLSFAENEEYEYEENQRSNRGSRNAKGGSRYGQADLDGRMGEISLGGLRRPQINSWDSMGILGLTSKMWHDTKKRQESFMQSTGKFLREEEAVGSYIM